MNKKQERIRKSAEEYATGIYKYPTEGIYPEGSSDWEKGYWAAIDQEEWKELYAEGLQVGIQVGKDMVNSQNNKQKVQL